MRMIRIAAVPVLAAGLVLAACSKKSETTAPAAEGQAPAAGAMAEAPMGAITAAQMPKMKPGLWAVTSQAPGAPAPQTIKQCITADHDLSKEMAKNTECSNMQFSRTAAGYQVDAQCDSEGAKTTLKGVFAGDFNSRVTMDMDMTMAMAGMAPQTMKVHSESVYEGPCTPADASEPAM